MNSCAAARAASQKALLKCAFETSSASGFPSISATRKRSSLGNSASASPTSPVASAWLRHWSARLTACALNIGALSSAAARS
eukprot:scaffold69046_cov77-Phaeocystis_antarctica.AAC.11